MSIKKTLATALLPMALELTRQAALINTPPKGNETQNRMADKIRQLRGMGGLTPATIDGLAGLMGMATGNEDLIVAVRIVQKGENKVFPVGSVLVATTDKDSSPGNHNYPKDAPLFVLSANGSSHQGLRVKGGVGNNITLGDLRPGTETEVKAFFADMDAVSVQYLLTNGTAYPVIKPYIDAAMVNGD